MKAVRIHGELDLRVEELPPPTPTEGTVLLTGGYTGICGTDLHLYFTPESYGADFSIPAELTGATWPQILGHEFSGEVSEVGPGVQHPAPGDRVAVFPYRSCGRCAACAANQATSCELMAFDGIQGHSGGMAEIKVVDADRCFVLPDAVDLRLGALVEPMAVAWHAVEVAGAEQGASALVVGGGPIGVGTYVALRAKGVETVVVSEPSAERRLILQRLGVQHVVDPVTVDLTTAAHRLTAGLGVDVAIDTAGAVSAFAGAMRSLAIGGRMVLVALPEEPLPLTRPLLLGGRSIQCSSVYTREDYRAVIDAMGHGLYPPASDWVHVIGFDEAESVFHELRAGRRMKVLVRTR